MSKLVCTSCESIFEADSQAEICLDCKDKNKNMAWAAEHKIGAAQGVSEDIISDLRVYFQEECVEAGMYLSMAKAAYREGYAEIGTYFEKSAYQELEHAAKYAELLGEAVSNSTKKNLEKRIEAENKAVSNQFELSKRAKASDLDAIHDTVHEMAREKADIGIAFSRLLERYFI